MKFDVEQAGVAGEGETIKPLRTTGKTSASTEWAQVKQLPAARHESSLTGRWLLPVVRVAVPVLVAGLLWRAGRTTMATIVMAIAVALTLASLISARARFAVNSATEWLATWGGRAVSFVVLTIVYAVIFLPVALVLRLRGRAPLQMRFDPARDTYWDPIVRPAVARRLYTRPFAYEAPQQTGAAGQGRSVLRRVIGQIYGVYAFIAALLVANFLGGLWLVGKPAGFLAGRLRGHEIPALRPYDWIPKWEDDYTQHSTNRFDFRPIVEWRHPDFKSEWINTRSGIRKSYEPATHEQSPLTLHFFGGSTIWGTDQRDLHTIPSEFARIAEAHGIPVRVTNYGQLGYTSIQEAALFVENCVAGTVPDIAVFYDGFNDIAYAVQDETLADEPPLRLRDLMVREVYRRDDPYSSLKKYSAIQQLYERWLDPQTSDSTQDNPWHAPEEYLPRLEKWYFGNARLVQQLGSSYGARVFSFLQPHYATKKPDPRELPPELLGKQFWGRDGAYELAVRISQLVRQHLPEYMIDLSSALDNSQEPVMVDLVHHSELGARMVAEQMFKHIEPALRAALHDRAAKRP